MAFLHWVAYIHKDRLICPLSKCQEGEFRDLEEFLGHVSTCQWLPDADYWCPYCQKQERFGISELQGGFLAMHQIGKLKKALFKRIGCGSDSTAEEPPANPRYHQGEAEGEGAQISVNLLDKEHTAGHVYLMQGSPDFEKTEKESTPPAIELQAPSWRCAEMPSPETVVHELPGGVSWLRNRRSRNTSYELRISTQTLGPARCYGELPGSLSEAQPSIQYLDVPEDGNLISPLSPNSLQSAGQCVPIPVSPTASPTLSIRQAQQIGQDSRPASSNPYSITAADKENSDELGVAKKQSCEKEFIAISRKNVSRLEDGEIPPPYAIATLPNRDALYTMEVANPLKQVEVLNQLICVFNHLWTEYLNNGLAAHSLLNGLNLGSPFDEGLSGFKSCLGGKPPTTLKSVFSFVHLAYACASVYHGNDASFSWAAFYENVRHWGLAISHQQERYRFFEIADLLWSPPQTTFNSTADTLPAYTYPTQEPFEHESTAKSMNNMHSHHARASLQEITVSMTPVLTLDLQSALGNGVLVGCCIRFLDGKTS